MLCHCLPFAIIRPVGKKRHFTCVIDVRPYCSLFSQPQPLHLRLVFFFFSYVLFWPFRFLQPNTYHSRTHIYGNILDLIISPFLIHTVFSTNLSTSIFDHFLINFWFFFQHARVLHPLLVSPNSHHSLVSINTQQFCIDHATPLPEHSDPSVLPDTALCIISKALITCLEARAPLIPKTVTSRLPSRRKQVPLNAVYEKLHLMSKTQVTSP